MEPAYQSVRDAFIISSKSPGTLNFYEEGKKLASDGKAQEALFLYQVGLHSDRQQYGEESKEAAVGYYNVANALRRLGQYPEAEVLFQQAVALEEKFLPPADVSRAITFHQFGPLYYVRKDYEKAAALYRSALNILEATYGKYHPDTILVRRNLQKSMESAKTGEA